MTIKHPYAVPTQLPADLTRVRAYWEGLLRGSATVPFADDLNLADLPDLADGLFVIGVFGPPERFRFDLVGRSLAADDVEGRFLDEIDLHRPFEFLRSQCAATVECRAPTAFRSDGAAIPYLRLVLPLWSEGRISMLLGAVDGA
ncbi:MAG: hypothetical protein JSR98_13205 [Proteobacteria bacterium]|nr:hypothetical protein [Pseudomonadota bacterium]